MIIALALDRTMVPICTVLRYWKTTVDGRVTNIDTNVKKAITMGHIPGEMKPLCGESW
jgi:hypothetical protein